MLPLKVIVPVEYVAVPVTLFPFPDLSFHVVTLGVEFMVAVSAASNHSEQPTILRGSNAEMLLDVPSIVYLEQNIP